MAAQRIKFILRPQQQEILDNLKRFNVVLMHRRAGKTYAAIIWLLKTIHECKRRNARGYYFSPTYQQSKRIAWQYLKDFTQHIEGVVYNESELRVNWQDKQIVLGSADNPDSFRGIYIDACVADEPALFPSRMVSEVMRPAMADRGGKMVMIGTPAGRHGVFYDAWVNAEDDPIWSRHMYKASETGIIPKDELEAMRRSMTKGEYDQELECSFDAAIKGAYWSEVMQRLEADGHIDDFPHDPGKLVHCSFDLGVNDSTAIFFGQKHGAVWHMIDHLEFTNTGLPDIIKHLRGLPYQYGPMIFPHDVEVQSLSTGQTRKQTLLQLGVDVRVAPKLPVIDGIDTTRIFLERCRFDRVKCQQGLEALRQYRSDWDDKKGVLRLTPLHDWSSHSADSMRYFATGENLINTSWGAIDYSAMDGKAYA